MKFTITAGLVAFVTANTVSPFSLQQAKISRTLSAYAYCGAENYMTQTYLHEATGFIVTVILQSEIAGYIGYLPSDQSIYVVFKGTTT